MLSPVMHADSSVKIRMGLAAGDAPVAVEPVNKVKILPV
jgi:hypothetical protein